LFNKFISTIDYRKDSTKTYSFINKLQNKYERPFSINGRVIESDAETANTFASCHKKKPPYVIQNDRNIKKETLQAE